MTKNKLIELAATSKMLKGLSAKLCNYRDIHNDLFQEFLLCLLEKPEQFLIDKFKEGQFIHYSSNVIRGLNINRYRDTKFVNSKNTLVERNDIDLFGDYYDFLDNTTDRNNKERLEIFNKHSENYNFDIDIKFEKTVKFVKEHPDKFKSEILFKSVVSTTRQIASELGLNQRKLIYENNKFKSEIRNNVK